VDDDRLRLRARRQATVQDAWAWRAPRGWSTARAWGRDRSTGRGSGRRACLKAGTRRVAVSCTACEGRAGRRVFDLGRHRRKRSEAERARGGGGDRGGGGRGDAEVRDAGGKLEHLRDEVVHGLAHVRAGPLVRLGAERLGTLRARAPCRFAILLSTSRLDLLCR
jgi:hypothetical protein